MRHRKDISHECHVQTRPVMPQGLQGARGYQPSQVRPSPAQRGQFILPPATSRRGPTRTSPAARATTAPRKVGGRGCYGRAKSGSRRQPPQLHECGVSSDSCVRQIGDAVRRAATAEPAVFVAGAIRGPPTVAIQRRAAIARVARHPSKLHSDRQRVGSTLPRRKLVQRLGQPRFGCRPLRRVPQLARLSGFPCFPFRLGTSQLVIQLVVVGLRLVVATPLLVVVAHAEPRTYRRSPDPGIRDVRRGLSARAPPSLDEEPHHPCVSCNRTSFGSPRSDHPTRLGAIMQPDGASGVCP